MVISNSLTSFGRYCLFMRRVFTVPDKWKVFFNRTIFEINKLGVDSIPLVMIISIFIGAVIAIQMQLNISSPLIPAYSVFLQYEAASYHTFLTEIPTLGTAIQNHHYV